MLISLTTLLATLCSLFRSRVALELENLAVRHQIGVLQRSARKRRRLTPVDRLLWVWLSRIWGDWRSALQSLVPAKAGATPSDNCFRADEKLFPRRPKATGEEPEDSVNGCKTRPGMLSLQHSQLLPQCQILDEKVST
jgi:hypothetical protein